MKGSKKETRSCNPIEWQDHQQCRQGQGQAGHQEHLRQLQQHRQRLDRRAWQLQMMSLDVSCAHAGSKGEKFSYLRFVLHSA